MTTMQATAIISAVDRASAVFRRVAMNAQAAAGRYNMASAALTRVGGAMSSTLGIGGGFASALALSGEYQIDKLTRLMQSAGELNDKQREMLSRSAIDASVAAAVQAQDIIKGQRELIQGGLDADTVARTTEMFAKIARTNDIATATAAEDAISVANAMGFAMDTVENKMASLKRAMEFMSVVPSLSLENWEGLRTSLKYAAPVAGALKIPIEELGAALSILADAGFRGEQGGTALRTIMARAIAPTRQARQEMRAYGVQLEHLYKFDQDRLGNVESLRERLFGAGLGQGNKLLDGVLAEFKDPSKFRSVWAMSDALVQRLSKALGIGKGDAESRGILEKVVAGHITGSTEGFDLETFFSGLAKLPPQALRQLAGLQRLPQAIKLRDEINKILEMPTGERISRLRHLANEFQRLMPNSIERRFEPVSRGFAWQIDRIMTSLAALRNTVFGSGVGEDLTNFFAKLSLSVRNMRETDPDQLKRITYGLAGLAALGPAGLILGGIATSFGTITKALRNPALRGLAAGGGIAALLGVDLAEPFMSKTWTPFGEETATFLGPNAPIMETARRAAELFTQISGSIGDIVKGVAGMFNVEFSESPLLGSLNLLNKGLSAAANSIEYFRNLATGEKQDNSKKTGWFWDIYNKSEQDAIANWQAKQGVGRFASPSLRDVAPPTSVQVQGQANVNVESKVRIEIDGPGRVVEQSGGSGATRVPLNAGQSMPDTGPRFGGPR